MTQLPLDLTNGLRLSGLDDEQLWVRYLALGGSGDLGDLRRHVRSVGCPDPQDHKVIAQALNEAFIDRGHDHPVAYGHLFLHPDASGGDAKA